jgi:hypothetical protein
MKNEFSYKHVAPDGARGASCLTSRRSSFESWIRRRFDLGLDLTVTGIGEIDLAAE